MDRAEAWGLLTGRIEADHLVKHSLASEAIMRHLARRLGEDEEAWGLAGLLHDLDFAETKDAPERHGLVSAEALAGRLPQASVDAIVRHNAEALGLERVTRLDLALTAAETITGLVMATAFVYPDKKLASVKAKSITKRMKEKAFAANVNRDHIRLCEAFGLPLEEFAQLALTAMQEIHDQLGV